MMPPRTTGPRQPPSHGQGHRVRREPPRRNGPPNDRRTGRAQPRCRTSAHGADPTARPATPMQTGGDRPKTLQPRAPASTWAADLHKSTSACYAPCTRHHTNATVPARTRSASTPQRVRPSRADAPQAAAAHPVPAGLVTDTIRGRRLQRRPQAGQEPTHGVHHRREPGPALDGEGRHTLHRLGPDRSRPGLRHGAQRLIHQIRSGSYTGPVHFVLYDVKTDQHARELAAAPPATVLETSP